MARQVKTAARRELAPYAGTLHSRRGWSLRRGLEGAAWANTPPAICPL